MYRVPLVTDLDVKMKQTFKMEYNDLLSKKKKNVIQFINNITLKIITLQIYFFNFI